MNKLLAAIQILLILGSLVAIGGTTYLLQQEREKIKNSYMYHLRNPMSETIYIDIQHDGEWQTIPLTPNREISIIGG